jgi:curli biogenesis system outer membrane secretion channel CsgG
MYKAAAIILMTMIIMVVASSVDLNDLTKEISASIVKNVNPDVQNSIALWKIENQSSLSYNDNELRDLININLIKTHQFDVVDRSRLDQLLEEIEFTGSGLVDPDTMKRLGEMYGIDLFLYGTFYDNEIAGSKNTTLILKAIDVERSQIAWAIELPVGGNYLRTSLDETVDKVVSSLAGEQGYLSGKGIQRISFWDIRDFDNKPLPKQIQKQVIDKLTVKLFEAYWDVVDRENLNKLLEELQFSESGLISQEQRERIGLMYGIDGFIYGAGSVDFDGQTALNLLLINTETGVLEWGDNLKIGLNAAESQQAVTSNQQELLRQEQARQEQLLQQEQARQQQEQLRQQQQQQRLQQQQWESETKWTLGYISLGISVFCIIGGGVYLDKGQVEGDIELRNEGIVFISVGSVALVGMILFVADYTP